MSCAGGSPPSTGRRAGSLDGDRAAGRRPRRRAADSPGRPWPARLANRAGHRPGARLRWTADGRPVDPRRRADRGPRRCPDRRVGPARRHPNRGRPFARRAGPGPDGRERAATQVGSWNLDGGRPPAGRTPISRRRRSWATARCSPRVAATTPRAPATPWRPRSCSTPASARGPRSRPWRRADRSTRRPDCPTAGCSSRAGSTTGRRWRRRRSTTRGPEPGRPRDRWSRLVVTTRRRSCRTAGCWSPAAAATTAAPATPSRRPSSSTRQPGPGRRPGA